MANSDKNILITPNKGAGADPKIEFSGANTSIGPQTISLNILPASNGTLSFEGSAGQLFSITNDLTGTIFSVNDVSGIPSIEVNASGNIKIAEFSGNVAIGSTSSTISMLGSTNLQLYKEKIVTIGTVTAATNINLSTGNIFDITLGGNITFTFTNPPAATFSQPATIILRQDATGSRTATFTGAKFTDGVLPALSTGATDIDVLTFFTIDQGTSYFGTLALANVS